MTVTKTQSRRLGLQATGVMTHAGDQAFPAALAVWGRERRARANPGFSVMVDGTAAPALIAAADGGKAPPSAKSAAAPDELTTLPPLGETPEDRFAELAIAALRSALEGLAPASLPHGGLIHVLLPGADCARAQFVDEADIALRVRETLPALSDTELRFTREDAGAVTALGEVRQLLQQGQHPWVLFGGVDTLIDIETQRQLALVQRLCCEGKTVGRLPGEAAAFALLTDGATELPPPGAWIEDIGVAPEPNVGQADEAAMTGLAEAIRACGAADCDRAWTTLGAEPAEDLEWDQARRVLWPVLTPQRYRRAAELGLLSDPPVEDSAPTLHRLHVPFGDVGAASVPLQLALAAAAIDFDRCMGGFGVAAARGDLICETGGYPTRGAVRLIPG